MRPLELSANPLMMEPHVPVTRINDPLRRTTFCVLARYSGTSPQFWINLQANYHLEVAMDASGALVESQVKPRRAA